MKRLLYKTLFFSLPIIILLMSSELLLRNMPNDYKKKKLFLDQNAEKVQTLILGNSHTYYGLNPEFFSTFTYNNAHISQSLDYDFELYKLYENKYKELKFIILPISYFSLFSNLESGENWRIKNYVIYYDIIKTKNLTHYSESLSFDIITTLSRIKDFYINQISPVTSSETGWGMGYTYNNQKNLIKTGETAAQRHTIDNLNNSNTEILLKENLAILEEFFHQVSEKNIEVFLITLPVYNSYLNNINPKQLDKTISTAHKIAGEHNHVHYFNFIDDSTFTKDHFYDADHLSDTGSIKFSKKINLLIETYD